MTKRRYPKPRKWMPTKNPEKYVGDINNIIARSSWEIKFLNWCDNNNAVISYNSEDLKIDYCSPIDNRMHKYHVDFVVKMKLKDGSFKIYAIEIKPNHQRFLPKPSKNKIHTLTETATYIVNQAKWAAADLFCRKNSMEFVILTEKDLCI